MRDRVPPQVQRRPDGDLRVQVPPDAHYLRRDGLQIRVCERTGVLFSGVHQAVAERL